MTTAMTSPVIHALQAAVTPALGSGQDAFTLLDGVSDQQQWSQRSLTIPGRWDPDALTAVSAESMRSTVVESGAGRLVREDTSVVCLAYCGDGSVETTPKRDALSALLSDLGDAVRGITDINGVAAIARLTDQQWAEVLDGQGVGVMVEFTITVSSLP